MKEYFEKLIARKESEIDEKKKRMTDSNDVNEVRSLGEEITNLRNECDEARKQLSELNARENTEKNFEPAKTFNTPTKEERNENVDVTETMEYRKAFMNYAKDGIRSDILKTVSETRASGTVADLGVMIPRTVIQEIITGVDKTYGTIYNKVRHFNIKGGVEIPIGEDDAVFTRQAEGTSGTATAGFKNTDKISFTYKIGEVKVSRSILETVVGDDVVAFERKFAEAVVKAYLKAMDNEILNGNGTTQFEGILTDVAKAGAGKIKATNLIDFTVADIADWDKWQKNLFAKLPIGFAKLPFEFIMTRNTYEGNIMTLKDANNRPVYSQSYDTVTGYETNRFRGRHVELIETDLGIKDYDTASNGDVFALVWVPTKAYGVNTNMEFTQRNYFDENKNEWVRKALTINDGKILDGGFIYALKKKSE